MASTSDSQRAVFRTIAQTAYHEWPAYSSTPLYDRSSLDRLEADVRTVSEAWFDQEAHESAEQFVCHLPLTYVDFRPHDRYAGSTQYGMPQLVRIFLLKELHGWSHKTTLVEHLQQHPLLRQRLGFETVPDQSTLWRSWHRRFTADLRETVETAARTILIKADRADVLVPREPPNTRPRRETEDEPTLDHQTVLDRAKEITNHVSRIVFPAFSLDRGEGCELHENAFWDL